MGKLDIQRQNVTDRLVRAGVKLTKEQMPGEIRIDPKSVRLTQMMGFQTVRRIEQDGRLSNYYVVQLPTGDPSVRDRPTDNIEYGISPIKVRR